MDKRVIQKKVCLLGDFAVGKTSLVRRYVEGRFDDKYLSTIGVKISRKPVERADHTLNLLIWDLAGGEDFDNISNRYLLGATGALIVCDLTRPETLDTLAEYAQRMREMNPTAGLVMTGNKMDLVDQRAISDDSIRAMGDWLDSPWLLTSAKTGDRVEEAFMLLASLVEDQG